MRNLEQKDFFISYNKDNKEWAKWVAGTLEENNYSVYLQAWDISPGDDFISQMNEFLKLSKNYIAIWSSSFFNSTYCKKELQTAFNEKLKGEISLFLPIRVEDIPLDPLYQTTVYIDLFNCDEESATKALLNGISHTENPRKKGKFPNASIFPQSLEGKKLEYKFPISDSQLPHCKPHVNSSVRNIVMLENNSNKKGDLFNKLVYDVFHALGFSQPSFNVQKAGREIDIALYHRTENRIALVESKAQNDKIGGSDINKFIGVLDVERRRYEHDGSRVVGYYVSQSGFTETALEQERERSKYRNEHDVEHELILLGPEEISRELVQGNVICSDEKAASKIFLPKHSQLAQCKYSDLLACEYGWVWVLYYSPSPYQAATHFSFVHADGSPLLSTLAKNLIEKSKQIPSPFSTLIYIDVSIDKSEEKNNAKNAYFNYLATELSEIQFEGMPTDQTSGIVRVNLENIFVPMNYHCIDKQDETIPNRLDRISIRDVLCNSPRAAILARPGGGKSTLIRRMALAYAFPERKVLVDDRLPDNHWFPIYIRCRDLRNDATKSISEIIAKIAYRAEIHQHESAFNALIEDEFQAGRVLLLIDGLDEISVEQNRIAFVNQLRTFIATYPSVHLVITSREPGFRAVAGVMASYCDQYVIADLNKKQIQKLSLKWHAAILTDSAKVKDESGKVCNIILNDHRIFMLAKNPLLLTTLLFVKRWIGYLPTKRCQLYKEMIKLLLVTWNASGHERLDLDETEPQLAYIAYQMTKDGQAKVTKDKLERLIIASRRVLPDILGYTCITPANFIDQVEERSSLLIQQGMEENERGILVPSYEFSHLSFQEYLAAKAVVEAWTPESETTKSGLEALLENNYNETQWIEVIPLAAVLSGRQVRKSIEFLLHKAEENPPKRVDSREHHGIPMDNLAVLHLANMVVNEVPMEEKHLDKALKLILGNKRVIEETYRHSMNSTTIIYSTIANNKYGNRYCTILDEVLFGEYDDAHIVDYLEAWNDISNVTGKNPILHDILHLLNNPNRKEKILGAYKLMMYAYRLNDKKNRLQTKEQNREIYKKIYAQILLLLKSDDMLAVFCAAWSIAWSGYNFRNIYPELYVQETFNRLIELWLQKETPQHLRRQVAWAICSVCKQSIEVKSTPELQESIEQYLLEPKNDYDDRTALFLGILCKCWSREETQMRLDSLKNKFIFDEMRLLEDFGYKSNIKIWEPEESDE